MARIESSLPSLSRRREDSLRSQQFAAQTERHRRRRKTPESARLPFDSYADLSAWEQAFLIGSSAAIDIQERRLFVNSLLFYEILQQLGEERTHYLATPLNVLEGKRTVQQEQSIREGVTLKGDYIWNYSYIKRNGLHSILIPGYLDGNGMALTCTTQLQDAQNTPIELTREARRHLDLGGIVRKGILKTEQVDTTTLSLRFAA